MKCSPGDKAFASNRRVVQHEEFGRGEEFGDWCIFSDSLNFRQWMKFWPGGGMFGSRRRLGQMVKIWPVREVFMLPEVLVSR